MRGRTDASSPPGRVIEFADEDDLDRILGILVPHDATRALAE